tara:strand:- start:11 stop:268 length:258 start_codon:yes stop_codon:yes gene_type:complete
MKDDKNLKKWVSLPENIQITQNTFEKVKDHMRNLKPSYTEKDISAFFESALINTLTDTQSFSEKTKEYVSGLDEYEGHIETFDKK